MAYIDNAAISANLFNDETVPSANTVSTTRCAALIARTTNRINGWLQVTSDVDDTYGDIAEVALDLFLMGLKGERMVLDKEHKKTLNKYQAKVPFSRLPSDDYNTNSSLR